MKEELISVIVPIYNIEKYIEKCVRSIINQTYTNIEILLVIDGATDNSLKVCEKFEDSRIKILYKKNGGLSDARNYGLKYAKGKYVLLVDGDDFIESNMVEILYKNLKETNSDISVCSFRYYYESGKVQDYYTHNDNNEIIQMNKEEALLSIISNKLAFRQCAWNKLYKKELFDNIKYPFGKLYEDMGTTYKLIIKSERIVYTHKNLYNYVQRGNSITKTFNFNKREFDRIEMANDFCNSIIKLFPKLKYQFLEFKAMQYIAVSNVMIRNKCTDNNLIIETKNIIKGNLFRILRYASTKEKIQIFIYYVYFPLYKFLFLKSI